MLTVKYFYDADGKILAHPKAQQTARAVEEMTWEEEPDRQLVKVVLREPHGRPYNVTNDWPDAAKRFFRWIRKETG